MLKSVPCPFDPATHGVRFKRYLAERRDEFAALQIL